MGSGVVEDFLEGGAGGEVGFLGDGFFFAQEALGGHDDERLAEGAGHLAAQEVEVLGWGGEVADLDILFGA